MNEQRIKSFVLRKGKMTTGQKRAYDELYEKYCLGFKEEAVELSQIFGRNAPTICEIGFGMGHATWQIAKHHPEKNYLGIEVHRPGVGALLKFIQDAELQNIRIVQHDAVEVLEWMIPVGSLDGFHIFFPDPWQKKRHHKRRLIQVPFVRFLLSRLKAHGYIYAVTDWDDYAEQMNLVFEEISELRKQDSEYPYRPETKFERKGIQKDHPISEFYYIKK
jgi:tRNA (guanine-N7-)-methyltransferase